MPAKTLMGLTPRRAAACLLGAFFATTAHAQRAPADQQAFNALFDRYFEIATGWHLDGRCRHLNSTDRLEYDWQIGEIGKRLAPMQAGSGLLAIVNSGAKQKADEWACGTEAQGFLTANLPKARSLHSELGGKAYDQPTAHMAAAGQLIQFYVVQALDDRCKLLSSEARTMYDSDVQAVGERFASSYGPTAHDRVKAGAAAGAQANAASLVCSSELARQLQDVAGRASRAAAP